MNIFDYDNLIVGEKIFGLEIIDDTVKVLEIKRSGSKFVVAGFGEEQLDPGVISNGIIVNKEEAAQAFKKAMTKAKPGRIRRRHVGVVLPDSKIFVRVVNFPAGMNKEEVREAVEWKAKDLIAMPLEKVYWDWHRITKGKEGEEIEVVISAVEKKCADSFIQTLELLGITPLYYDISGNAAARFLFQEEYKKRKALLVRIDRNSITLSLFINGGIRYQKTVSDIIKGGYGVLIDLAATKLGLPARQAEGLILYPSKLSSSQKALLKDSFAVKFQHLAQGIEQVLDFYDQTLSQGKKEKKSSGLEGIFLYGRGAKVYYLDEFFSEKPINVSTKVHSISSVSPILQFVSRESLIENLVLLGMSFRNLNHFKEHRDINLVPKLVKRSYLQVSIYSRLLGYLRTVCWNLIAIIVVLTISYFVAQIYKSNANEELKAVENLAESKANKELSNSIVSINETATKTEMVLATQLDWDKFFKVVSESKGEGIKFDNLLVTEDEEAWKAISGKKKTVKKTGFIYLVISGTANTRDNLQAYVSNMESTVLFQEVKMPISSYEESSNIKFTIYCLVDTQKLKKAVDEL